MRATTFYRADTFYRQITSKGKWFRTPEELGLMEDQTASSIMFTENVSRKLCFSNLQQTEEIGVTT